MALDALEMAAIRANAYAEALTDTGQIIRNTSQTAASDALGGGGVQADYQNVGSPIQCRLKIHRPKAEEVVAGQVRSMTMFETRWPVGTDIREYDRVQITSGDYPGLYDVSSVERGQSARKCHPPQPPPEHG